MDDLEDVSRYTVTKPSVSVAVAIQVKFVVVVVQVRLIVQAEQETLRVHDRVSRVVGGGSVLSACSLLDTDAVTASHWDTVTSSCSRDDMMHNVVVKFSKLRVSPVALSCLFIRMLEVLDDQLSGQPGNVARTVSLSVTSNSVEQFTRFLTDTGTDVPYGITL